MREIRLYGHLGDRFGRVFNLDVKSPAEAIAALAANFPDFRPYLMKHSEPGYRVVVGREAIDKLGLETRSEGTTIKIIPVIHGAGAGLKIIVGAILVVASIFFPFLAPIGIGLIVGGVAQALFAPPTATSPEKPNNQPSYTFNGPVNTTKQGNPVPVCYGEMIVGSQVIYAGISVEQLVAGSGDSPTSPTLGHGSQSGQATLDSSVYTQTVGNVQYSVFALRDSDALINSLGYTFTWDDPKAYAANPDTYNPDGSIKSVGTHIPITMDGTYDGSIPGFKFASSLLTGVTLPNDGAIITYVQDDTTAWGTGGNGTSGNSGNQDN